MRTQSPSAGHCESWPKKFEPNKTGVQTTQAFTLLAAVSGLRLSSSRPGRTRLFGQIRCLLLDLLEYKTPKEPCLPASTRLQLGRGLGCADAAGPDSSDAASLASPSRARSWPFSLLAVHCCVHLLSGAAAPLRSGPSVRSHGTLVYPARFPLRDGFRRLRVPHSPEEERGRLTADETSARGGTLASPGPRHLAST